MIYWLKYKKYLIFGDVGKDTAEETCYYSAFSRDHQVF